MNDSPKPVRLLEKAILPKGFRAAGVSGHIVVCFCEHYTPLFKIINLKNVFFPFFFDPCDAGIRETPSGFPIPR